jgi:hypothetical protein
MSIRPKALPRADTGALCLIMVSAPAVAQTTEERQRRVAALSELFAERRAVQAGGPLP